MNLTSKQFKNTRYPSGEEMKRIAKRTKLVDENISLNRKNHLLWVGLIGLSVLSALSVSSCRKNASDLDKANQQNKIMAGDIAHYQQEVRDLAIENFGLKTYANDAEDFVSAIHPLYPTERDGLTSLESGASMIQADSSAEKEDAKVKNEYEKACEVFGFNEKERQAQLLRLQQGWQR